MPPFPLSVCENVHTKRGAIVVQGRTGKYKDRNSQV